MAINKNTLEKTLQMACLDLSPEQKAAMHDDLNKMVNWVKKLLDVDTTGVKPLSTMSYEINKLRPDEPEKPLPQEKALLNAPSCNNPYFCVPVVKQ